MKKVLLLAMASLALLVFSSTGSYAANSVTVTMKAQNGSGQDGTATITQSGDADVMVTVDLRNGTSVAQPAHIHKGTCANLNPVPAFPLANVVNGKSDNPAIMVSMAELEKGGYAINVHKSAAEVSTYVSCGDIPAMAMSTSSTSSNNSSMPATGSGDQFVILLGLTLLALAIAGAGLKLAGRKA